MAAVSRFSFEQQVRDKLSNALHGYTDHAAHQKAAPVQARALRRDVEKMIVGHVASAGNMDTTLVSTLKHARTGTTITFTPSAGSAPRINP